MALTQVTTGGVDENINIDSNTLKVDGTNNRVGIGTASPSESLEISTSANETPAALSLYSRDTSIAGTQEIGAIYGKGLDSGGSGPYVGGKITFAADGTWDTGTNYYYPTAIKFYTQQATGTDNVAAGPRMVIDSSGRLLVGTNSNFGDGSGGDALQVATTTGGHLLLGRNDSSVSANNTIGLIRGYSYGGSAWQETARISIQADDAHASGDKPGRILFSTTADGASSPTERMRIDSSGNVGIGTTNPIGDLTVSNGGASGIELQPEIATNTNRITNYNRSASSYNNFRLDAAQHEFLISGSEKARIDSSGRLLVGTTTARSMASHAAALQVSGTDFSSSTVNITNNANSGNGAYLFFSKQRSGSAGGNTVLQNNDLVGQIRWLGADGTDLATSLGQISMHVDGTPGSNDMPGRMVFATTADGASSPTERMRINNTGAVTKPSNPLIKSNMGYLYGSSGSLTTSPASAILQASAEIDKGDNGWTTSGSNAYTFVCPVDGIYAVHAHTSLGSVTTGRAIWVMAYTAGGGNLPLANYVEVMDTEVTSHENYSYFNTWSFTAGTRVGFGINGGSGAMGNHSSQWGIYLLQ